MFVGMAALLSSILPGLVWFSLAICFWGGLRVFSLGQSVYEIDPVCNELELGMLVGGWLGARRGVWSILAVSEMQGVL